MAKFRPGVSGNPRGRPPVGLSFADKVRNAVGADGNKLVELWSAIAFNRLPPKPKASSAVLYYEGLKALVSAADLRDRLTCSRFLAERGFGQPKLEMEHSGTVNLPTTVVHEYYSS
jgi:hypothetical protein